MLTSQQLEKFEEQGFLIIPDFFDPLQYREEARKLLNEIDRSGHPRTRFTTGDDNHVADEYFLNSGDKICYFFEENASEERIETSPEKCVNKIGHALHELNPLFKKISTCDKVKQLASCLGYKDPNILQSMLIFKQPEIGGAVPGHVDSTFLYTDPPSCTGLWFALEDCNLHNGCMFFAPGSHKKYKLKKRFVRDPSGKGTKMIFLGDNHSEPADHEYVAAPVTEGSLVLIHGLVYHKSGCNTSKKSRWIYTFHMIEGKYKYPNDNWLLPTEKMPFTHL